MLATFPFFLFFFFLTLNIEVGWDSIERSIKTTFVQVITTLQVLTGKHEDSFQVAINH